VHGDPEWVAYLSSHLTPDLYEPASLAGLSPRFSKKVLAQARAQLAANKGCYALKGSPLQLRGASAAEILALAEVLVGCEDKLGYFWEDLLTAAAWSPEASKALLAVIQLQGKRGDPAFWRHGSKAISIAGSVGTDEAVEPLLEVLRVAEAPRQGEEHSAWRFADEVIDQLRMLGTAKAGDALVEVARLCTGNCEGGGSCLWRERDTIKNAIEAIGGPERDARYAAVNALVAADKK
jgi:hypothetical protein